MWTFIVLASSCLLGATQLCTVAEGQCSASSGSIASPALLTISGSSAAIAIAIAVQDGAEREARYLKMTRQRRTYTARLAAAEEREADRRFQALEAAYLKLSAADEARDDGKIGVACRMYARLTHSKETNEHTDAAEERLKQMAAKARARLAQLDRMLEGPAKSTPPGRSLADRSVSSGRTFASPAGFNFEDAASRCRTIQAVFAGYDELEDRYGRLPRFGRELKRHIDRKRHEEPNAAALAEPVAATLWAVGQRHEAQGELYCAMICYEKAAKTGSPLSGRVAANRLAVMKLDRDLEDQAETCRGLRECQKLFRRADRLLDQKPDIARKLLADVVTRTPPESGIHQAAREKLAGLK